MGRTFTPHNKLGFTLIEVMIVVLVIGVLLGIAVPNFLEARRKSQLNSCLGNLRRLESAKDIYASENRKGDGDSITWDNIIPDHIKYMPTCPSGGTYSIQLIGQNPQCSVETHALPQ